MQKILTLLFLFMAVQSYAEVCENKGPNVILFTWDGVRLDEFFKGTGLSTLISFRVLKEEKSSQVFGLNTPRKAWSLGENIVIKLLVRSLL